MPKQNRKHALVHHFYLVVLCVAARTTANDLGALSDEFEDASSLPQWLRVEQVELWNANQLELCDVDTTQSGRLVMMPFTVVWYADYRGPLLFKEVTGDFVITTEVHSTGRDGSSIPESQYSLGGIMIRESRNITPGTWTIGGENYVFFSLGHGNNGGTSFQYEDKTTVGSNSTLILTNTASSTSILQIARLGEYVILLRRQPPGPWVVHRRFHRSDFPATMQVGMVTYTDWLKCQIFAPFVHNSNTLTPPLQPGVTDPNPSIPFAPDLVASFDYMRFFRPTLPSELVGVDLTNSSLVSDAQLIGFLGDNANVVGVPAASNIGLALITISLVAVAALLAKRGADKPKPRNDLVEPSDLIALVKA